MHVGDQYQRVRRHALRFRQRTGRRATPADLAAETGLDEDKLRAVLALLAGFVSLDAPLPDADTGLVELIEDWRRPARSSNWPIRGCANA